MSAASNSSKDNAAASNQRGGGKRGGGRGKRGRGGNQGGGGAQNNQGFKPQGNQGGGEGQANRGKQGGNNPKQYRPKSTAGGNQSAAAQNQFYPTSNVPGRDAGPVVRFDNTPVNPAQEAGFIGEKETWFDGKCVFSVCSLRVGGWTKRDEIDLLTL